MSNKSSYFIYRPTLSGDDWDMLSEVIKQHNANKLETERNWLAQKTKRFIRETVIPTVEHVRDLNLPPVEKAYSIPNAPINEHPDITALRDFVELLAAVYTADEGKVSRTEWITSQIEVFCREVALPVLEKSNLTTPTRKTVDCYIPNLPFHTYDQKEIVQRFANLKCTTPTKLINRYILYPHILKEEEKKIRGFK